MYKETQELYEFEKFRLDVREHTLTRSDGSKNYPLPEKAFQTLCVLVQRRGRLLTKQELLAEIWPDSFVEENNLDKCIHAIRQVLGEKPGEQKYIETVRKHGYRFVAQVHNVGTPLEGGTSVLDSEFLTESESNPTIIHPTPVLKPERAFSKLRSAIVAAVILLAVAIGSAYILYPAKKAAADDKTEFAVLPVNPIDPANRSDLYEIGMADSLIHGLNSVNGFVVRPLSATRKYSELGQDPIAAGLEQKVDYVLASSYQIADGRIKVTSQLLNVADGKIEETYKIENEITSIFAAQEAFAGSIRSKLMARFARSSVRSPSKRETSNEEAYNYYLQGMVFYDQRNGRKAVEAFEHAITLDPNYALAWAGKAYAHRVNSGSPRYSKTDSLEESHRSIEAANKALALNPELSEGYSALCENKYFYEYDFAGAERDCMRALELDPNSPVAHNIYSTYLAGRGRHDEAIDKMKTAIDLEPTSYFNQKMYANILYIARRYDEAVPQYKRLIDAMRMMALPMNGLSGHWKCRATNRKLLNGLCVLQSKGKKMSKRSNALRTRIKDLAGAAS